MLGRILLLIELLLRSILPPFYSFSMIEKVCKAKLKRRPNDVNVLWVLSNLYINYGKYNDAMDTLESLYINGNKARCIKVLLARVYFNLNLYDKVKEILIENEVIVYNDHGNYYIGCSLFKLGEFNNASKYLEKYVINHKNNYTAYVKIGYAYYIQGLFDLALNAYKMADKIAPMNKEIQMSIKLCEQRRLGGFKQSEGSPNNEQ